MALTMDEVTANCMEMIGYTGEGRSLVYEAVGLMVEDDYQAAMKKIEEAEDNLAKAHEIQFLKLMSMQARGDEIPCSMLLLHAMDILMTSTAEKDMVKAIVKAKIKKAGGVRT